MSITTHVLDTSRGKPGAGIGVVLAHLDGGAWTDLASARTDDDGRCRTLSAGTLPPGTYRLTFDVAAYFRAAGVETFYPHVSVVFETKERAGHYHVPLLLSPWGYSTYRGS